MFQYISGEMGGGGTDPLIFDVSYTNYKEASKLLPESLRRTLWGSKLPNFPGGESPSDPSRWLMILISEA